MKILFVLSRFPFPTLKGDKLRAYYQMKELSKNNEVHLICLAEDHEYTYYLSDIEPYCASIQVIPLHWWRKLLNLTQAVFSKKPFQVHYFYSPKIKKHIIETINLKQIDVCYVQLIRMGENIIELPNVGYYLDYMDAFSAGMEKRALRSSGIFRKVFQSEAKRLRNYETSIASHYQGLSIISEADLDGFNEAVKPKIQIIPNGISDDFLDFEHHNEKDIDIIFTGNMNYRPNVEAAKYLCLHILPELLKEKNDLKIYIVGTAPNIEVKNLASDHVTVTGFVPDLRPYLARSKMTVAPLFLGSGLQNKLLEAMALGIPVITSPHANRSLNAPAGEGILIGETLNEFVTAIRYLLDNEQKATEIGLTGKRYVAGHFDWARWNLELEAGLMKTCRNTVLR